MHLASSGFTLPPGTARPTWRDELRGLEGELPRTERALWAMIEEIAAVFEALPRSPDVYGVVHFDLSGDNVVWRDGAPHAIDFDDCMTHWYVADIARTVSHFREQARGEIGPHERAFLAGYEEVRPLPPDWKARLPIFLRFALMSELAWMMYASSVGAAVEFSADAEANLRRLVNMAV
jgi:Ser/Thr protein kinase RdoA (MazF antagonist)